MPTPIRVAIVDDDHQLRRTLLVPLIADADDMTCVGDYPHVEALLDAAPAPEMDVLLLDVGLPGMAGTEAIQHIKTRWPGTEIIMCTVYSEEGKIFDALRGGAVGYLLKDDTEAIVAAVREVSEGGAPMTASIARKVIDLFRRPRAPLADAELTDREEEVLSKLIEGKTNRQIAEALFIAPNTVAYHVKRIYKKLHVHSRAEAVAKAMQRRRFGPVP